MVIAAASTVVGPGMNMVKVRPSGWKMVSSRQRTGSPRELRVSIHIVRVALFASQLPSEIQNVVEVESAQRRRNFADAVSQVRIECPWKGRPSIWLRKSPVTHSPPPPLAFTSTPLRICGGSPGGPTTCMVASQAPVKRRNSSAAAAGGVPPAGGDAAAGAAVPGGGAAAPGGTRASAARTTRLVQYRRPDIATLGLLPKRAPAHPEASPGRRADATVQYAPHAAPPPQQPRATHRPVPAGRDRRGPASGRRRGPGAGREPPGRLVEPLPAPAR